MEHMSTGLQIKGKAIVRSVDKISVFVLRYGLVLVVFWIGCLKFTAYESKGVFNHASHSPLLAWA
jgi:reactive chlorine resistance protein C